MKNSSELTLLAAAFVVAVAHAAQWHMQPIQIQTRWAASVDPAHVLPDYPRPQLVRQNWENLNGLWQYSITPKSAQIPTAFEGDILVPYPVESALSGVRRALKPDELLWYQRTFSARLSVGGERTLLHFGAVDFQATVYLNGRELGSHVGGYQSFAFDITDAVKGGNNTLLVKVFDPTDDGPNPHGKQTLNPGGISYTATSGIWQTVWLERVPATYIDSLEVTSDVDNNQLHLAVTLHGEQDGYIVEALVRAGNAVVAMQKLGKGVNVLPIRNPHLWSPEDPFLYDLQVRLLRGHRTVDEVQSYFGMRKVELRKDAAGFSRIFLNSRYTYNLGTLDQGFWPEGLYTAPTEAALEFDIDTLKSMGFNTIRKHIKVEPDRWYYHCDKVGMMVWQDMVPPANDSPEARAEFETEVRENLAQLHNHPSITTWIVFNEGWGAYDQQRIEHLVKQLDPSRLLNGHSGASLIANAGSEDGGTEETVGFAGESSDINDFHAYPDPALRVVNPKKAQVIGEYGGVGVAIDGHVWRPATQDWGYVKLSREELATKYEKMIGELKAFQARGLAGSIYTQPYDVETEVNGLMTYDREVIKIPVAEIKEMNRALVPDAISYVGQR